MTIKKTASSNWSGDIKSGKGTISTQSGALDNQPYGFNTRFEDKPGSNPEELVGAAHSACFGMALSLALGEAGFTAENINTEAVVSLNEVDDGFAVTHIALEVNATIADISNEQFQALCEQTKKGCPISKLLNTEISLNATLK
ncbi:OsmC family peroxiredoxin [Pseudoalteromonas sp. S3260]|uniref:Peroxiredoxin OsmC n=1 Tax=Pseudoalteromonas haloplanktis TaxID=228 RepID=A0A9W4QYH1_PSEHA|nr:MULTISPECIES: OsmC family protein [Pseudoalteromonas]MCK8102027.1 OsmC family protein [Pseudoalteromonas sp. 2CM36K]MDN3487696.1 OsmC family protein [Pseudoalteromonas sp. APC 3694]TMO98407.1 OsmC family peroxiredoxin [Pseudoalteromonas sp. S3260]CAH9059059.1 Peroxiredoxin OsmC [Pseudoalteromonas haloplanktis]